MNLAQCLKKIGAKISDQDQKEINAAYRERRRLGMERKDAALGVIDARVDDLMVERADVLEVIKKAGIKVPDVKPPDKPGFVGLNSDGEEVYQDPKKGRYTLHGNIRSFAPRGITSYGGEYQFKHPVDLYKELHHHRR